VARAGGESVLGLVFFGSRKTDAGHNPWSAFDLFVLTRGYLPFYQALRECGLLGRSPALVAALNTVLPPNQVSVRVACEDGHERRAKCSVIRLDTFLRETSARRRDHFCIGRLFQPVALVSARDETTQRLILDGLASAHALTYQWVRPYLPEWFDVDDYCRTALGVSMAGEIRPEPGGRADALWAAQAADQRKVFAILLRDLAATGELRRRDDGRYALARPAGWLERLRSRSYFGWSRVRATARWLKYTVTFEGWLEYIVQKVQRHSGQQMKLTPRERRWPLVFLWPRVVRYLRQKSRPAGGRP
jgi:hypothetical protein